LLAFPPQEIIPLLPALGLRLIIIPPGQALQDPALIRKAEDLYARRFIEWGNDIPAEAWREVVRYTINDLYAPADPRRTLVFLDYDGWLIAGMVMKFGDTRQNAAYLVQTIAESFERPYHYDPTTGFDDPQFQDIYLRLLETPYHQHIQVGELFIEHKHLVKAKLELDLGRLLSALHENPPHARLSPVGQHTAAALHVFLNSFKKQALRHNKRKLQKTLVHNIYRSFTLMVLIGAFHYTAKAANFTPAQTQCSQWAGVGTQMDKIFNILCDNPSAKRLARLLDRPLPRFFRLSRRLPSDQSYFRSLIKLGRESHVVWRGKVAYGDGLDHQWHHQSGAVVSRLPLDGVLALIGTWPSYQFLMRQRFARRPKDERPNTELKTDRPRLGRPRLPKTPAKLQAALKTPRRPVLTLRRKK
jgi:hypothetical protein